MTPIKDALKTGLAATVGWVGGAYLFSGEDWRVVQSGWFWWITGVCMVSSYYYSFKRQRED